MDLATHLVAHNNDIDNTNDSNGGIAVNYGDSHHLTVVAAILLILSRRHHWKPVVCSFTRKLLSSPMATSSLRFAFSPLIHSQNSSKLLFSIPNYQTKSIRILGFSTSSPSPDTTLETLAPPPPPSHSVNNLNPYKWEPYRKKKVVMRVGYVGTDYRGLQMQKDDSISSKCSS
ncbi:unnamed protein product [Lactuca saligna]|uniref:tRNA pseudouridine synthase n=1 Tax=Lactuca saligna TaxID=75948 RepID=A0AA36EM81_LACSI|nr:unnamed protein product [Lactuca saligna]